VSSPPSGALPHAQASARDDGQSWFAPAVLVGIVLATGALYWPSTQSLLHEWFEVPNSAYRHGPLLVVIAVWLAIRAVRAAAAPAEPDARPWLWLALLALLSAAWLVAFRAGIQVMHQAQLPMLVWLAVRLVLGRRIALLSAVPIALLYSAIPVWHVAIPALQAMTVAVVSALLRIVGIPAYVEGDFVTIRSGVFHVEDGCAGLHYFIVAATLAALYGELRGDNRRVRAWLFALALALALVSNWLRVFIIIVAGYLTDMQSYLVRVDHATFGWAVFALAMIAFLLLGRLWAPPEPSREPRAAARVAGGALRNTARVLPWAALAAALGPAWALFVPVRAAAAPDVSMPAAIAGWEGPREFCQGRWRPQFPAADLRQQREFSRGGQSVCVYIASFLSQYQDKELIGYWSALYPPESEVVSSTVREAAGRKVNEVQLGDERAADRIVWYSYVVGAREMRRGIAAQFSYAFGTLSGAPAASIYAISMPCVPDCAAARRVLEEFLPNVGVRGNDT
jgi:EpsI family protein